MIMNWISAAHGFLNRTGKTAGAISSQKTLDKTVYFPLDCATAEVVFAPFHDPAISKTLPILLSPCHAEGCKIEHGWCWTTLSWDDCQLHKDAAMLSLKADVDISNYDNLLLCFALPSDVSVVVSSVIDGNKKSLGAEFRGTGVRMEALLPVRGSILSELTCTFIAHAPLFQVINLSWFGLQRSALLKEMLASRHHYDTEWVGLIKPDHEWGAPRFGKKLLFDERQMVEVRNKRRLPGWDEHYAFLEARATEFLERCPEDDIGDYIPLNDMRYIRDREKGRNPYHFEALLLGFIGLVNEDKRMMRHSLRYLMSMLHTRHWTQSAESRLRGSTWDQRCFFEELTATSVSLLADWYSFALTDRAKDLILQSLWDKGLAVIERDMMKYDYLYHMNQGAVFCRARILAGLMLESTWPHMGDYVDRAFSTMSHVLDNYIEKDGGMHEGIGYFSQTLHAVMPAVIGYGRSRRKNVKNLLRHRLARCENYVATMSGCIPGTGLPYGDCRTMHFGGDVIPVMAGFFPRSVYGKMLSACLKAGSIFAVTGTQSKGGGILSLVYGPDMIGPAENIVPTFSTLKKTGQLSSYRKSGDQSMRVQLCGSRANATHTHLDKGSVILEVDDMPVLIDRGMIEYWHTDTLLLRRSCMHNVITPALDDGTYPDQVVPAKNVIPFGNGDQMTLSAGIDVLPAWPEHMAKYTRRVESLSINELSLFDEGELKENWRVALHFHSPFPFSTAGDNRSAELMTGNIHLLIHADWATELIHRQESVDLKHEPIYHLVLLSRKCTTFALKTTITRL